MIGKLERERARLIGIVERLGEDGASRPVLGEWSARDVIAHCVYWQGMLSRMMGSTLRAPQWIPRWQSESELGTDELNRLTVEHYRRTPFDTLLSDFRFTADTVERIVTEMKEESLDLPAGQPWDEGAKVHEAISGETHGHWKEHADELEASLKSTLS